MLNTKNLRHNYIVNLLDGAFFGLALGFASFSTVIPLFVGELTISQTLIGLVPALHNVGWMGPQIFMAQSVARRKRLLPMVLWLTIHERIPFFGLALVALGIGGAFSIRLGVPPALSLVFFLLAWQGLGGGVTANAWQSMVAKVFPAHQRGTFLGLQSASANIAVALGAMVSGQLLERIAFPFNYAICFFIACVFFIVSFIFLALTKEPDGSSEISASQQANIWVHMGGIWRKDTNFRWFLLARNLMQFATMGFAFYSIYIVRHYGVGEGVAGAITALLATSQTIGNAILGWLGDHIGHKRILLGGALAAIASPLIALIAPNVNWFYLVVFLAGMANVAFWTISMTMTLEFGNESDRPTYIGMANTLVAPSSILAPVIGGKLADLAGFPVMFTAAIAFGAATFGVIFLVRDVKKKSAPQVSARSDAGEGSQNG